MADNRQRSLLSGGTYRPTLLDSGQPPQLLSLVRAMGSGQTHLLADADQYLRRKYHEPDAGIATKALSTLGMIPVQAAQSAVSAFTAPTRALNDPSFDPVSEAQNMAGMVTLGGFGLARAGLGPKGDALGMFAGSKAKTADLTALQRAVDLENGGHAPSDIWTETGWGRGADGEWRFEIDDSQSLFRGSNAPPPKNKFDYAKDYYEKNGRSRGEFMTGKDPNFQQEAMQWADLQVERTPPEVVPLQKTLHHPELFGAYNSFPDIGIKQDPRIVGARGTFDPKNDLISFGGSKTINDSPDIDHSVVLHELQHAVQSKEGFAFGGSPREMPGYNLSPDDLNDALILSARIKAGEKPTEAANFIKEKLGRTPSIAALDFATSKNPISPIDAYRRLAGEVEARNVQHRMDWDAAKRRATPPWFSEDVPRSQQIVRRLDPK